MGKYICAFFILLVLLSCNNASHKEAEAQRMFDYGMKLESDNVPDSAVYFYRKAIDLIGEDKPSELLVDLHIRLGNLLRTHHLYGRALQEHRLALDVSKQIDHSSCIVKTMREVGKDFLYQNRPDSALIYIQRALILAEQVKDSLEIMAAHNNLSVVYNELDSLEKAIEHAYESIRLSTDSLFIYRNYSAIGQMFMQVEQYDSAYYYSLQGSVSPNLFTRATCYKQLRESARMLGDEQAYERYTVLLEQANDSINLINRTEAMGETEYKHELEQMLNTEKIRYYRWLAIIIVFIVVCLFVYGFHKYGKRKRSDRIGADLCQGVGCRENVGAVVDNGRSERESVSLQVYNEREELCRLIEMKGDVCARSFVRTKMYKSVKSWIDAKSDSVLSIDEQQVVAELIHKSFGEYIEALRKHLGLTQDETLLCCLMKCGFSTRECAACKGVSVNAIRTQKSRIKSKFSHLR